MTSAVKLKPVIAAVTDSKGSQIPNGGTTKDTTVSVMGSSAPSQKIKLYNNAIEVTSMIADPDGKWVGRLTELVVGAQAIKAVSNGQESTVWSFTVVAPK